MPYATTPADSERMPKGVPFIVGNEAAERFSYYGMRAILVVYMTQHLLNASGELAPMGEKEALVYYHLFTSSAYLFPFLGALLADAFLGKYLTIISLSVVYCAGHAALALGDSGLGTGLGLDPRSWLFLGLALIALGSGGIKPCVSAHVGDQFGSKNSHLLARVFGWFYFAINLGAGASIWLIPILLDRYGASVAFGTPGVLMALATWVFWLGRNHFVHIPPGGTKFIKETFSKDGLRAIGGLTAIYVFVAMFWSLFDQTGSAWVLQAKRMDRTVLGYEILPSQAQALNPILIMLFIPLFSYVVYPLLNKVFTLTPLRKISIGLFLTVPSFLLSAQIEAWLEAGQTVSVLWQGLAFVIITAAEVMVSITALELSYTQAPNRMKSLIMGFYLLSVWAGNMLTSVFNQVIQTPEGQSRLTEEQYYLTFAGLMTLAAIGFVFVAWRYRPRSYIQGSS